MAAEYIVHNNDFSRYDEDPRMILHRVDRNNTHYYTYTRCPKCGGKGWLPGYEHVEGGVCFLCGGSGHYDTKVVVRTYEYDQKLTNRRIEKARKTAAERNSKYLKSRGFSEDGFSWIVMGNTFEIKDQLKAAGCKFDNIFLWHFDHEVTEWPTVRISIEDRIHRLNADCEDIEDTIGYYTVDGTLSFQDDYFTSLYIKKLRENWEAEHAPKTEWYGSIKDKINVKVKFVRKGSYETVYGMTMVYTFEDEAGHLFVWKTGCWMEQQIGDLVTLKGTVKAHNEYKGIKQTELTRCKVC